jgi:hypothetical protein
MVPSTRISLSQRNVPSTVVPFTKVFIPPVADDEDDEVFFEESSVFLLLPNIN